MDYDSLHEAAIAAMGGQDVRRLEYTGAGWDACLGQPWNINEGWARWELRDYHRAFDYDAGLSFHTAMRRPGLDSGRLGGCGAQPDADFSGQQSRVDGDSSWEQRLQVWLTPAGFLHLAHRHSPQVAREDGGWVAVFDVPVEQVTYTVRGIFDEAFLLRRIETWIDDTVFGDMLVEAEFSGYRDFDGLLFPESLVQRQGGFATLDLTIENVLFNDRAEIEPPPRPAGGGGGGAQASASSYTLIDDGVYVMTGSYQGVVVEFADFSVIIDGFQNDARTLEIIELTEELIPDKPIRYAVITHAHFDHAAGLRELIARGTTLLTHETNAAFFEQALSAPRTLNTNAIDTSAMPVLIEGVSDHHVIDDGRGQVVELHKLNGSLHADDVLIAHLPGPKAVVESDLLQPWILPIFGGAGHPYLEFLAAELDRLDLDYEQFVPVHGLAPEPTMPRSALLEAVQ